MMSTVASCAVTRFSPCPQPARGRPRGSPPPPCVTGSTALRPARRSRSCPRASRSASPPPSRPTSDAQPQSRPCVVACAVGRHSANVAAALLLERPRPAEDDHCIYRRTHPSDDPPPRLVSTTPAAPKQRAVKYSGPPASAASAGYAALAAAFSYDAGVARGLPEVCEEVEEVQERDGNEQRRVSRSNRRSLRKAMAVPGYQHAVVPLQGLRRGLRKVTGATTLEAAAEGPEGAAGTSGKSAAGEESPSCARQTLERSWSACSALDSMDMVSPSISKRRGSMSGSRRTPRAARGVSRRAIARNASAAVPVAPIQPVFAPTSEDYQKYSSTTLELMTGVSRVLFALSKTPSRGKKNARNIVSLLASSKPRDLMREEECTLLRAVKQGMSLKALARSRKAQGKDCTHEAVATIAGLPGGADELIMLDRLAEDAAEMLISQNIGLVMSLAHKYAASSSGGVGYEDLIPFGIQGLNKAMERFDHTRGTRFSTYAHWWIRQACMRGMSVESRVVKVPAWITETAGRILREMAVVRADPDVPQSAVLGEVAKRMEMTQEKVESVLAHVSNATSLDEPASSNGKGKFDGDRLEAIDAADALGTATEPTPEEVVESNGKDAMLRDQIEELLSQLHPRERHIIKMRHGLHSSDETGLTFTEIGIAYARTQERIRQIEDKAMRRLKYLVQQKNDPELAKHLGL